MKFRLYLDFVFVAESFNLNLGTVLAVMELIRNINLPRRKGPINRLQPFPNSGLTRVDLLSSSNETEDNGPIGVSIEAREQELGLGLRKLSYATLALHEICGLGKIPSALGFIENRNVFDRGFGIFQALIPEVMNVLDEGLYLAESLSLCEPDSTFLGKTHFVPSQRFLENVH